MIQQRKYAEAETVARRAIGKGDATITAMVWTDLATIEEAKGRYVEAAGMLQKAVAGMTASHARGRVLSNLSVLERRLKLYREAALHARQAVGEIEAHAGPQHPDVCETLERYAEALRHSGRREEAEQATQRAREIQAFLEATVDWRSVKK